MPTLSFLTEPPPHPPHQEGTPRHTLRRYPLPQLGNGPHTNARTDGSQSNRDRQGLFHGRDGSPELMATTPHPESTHQVRGPWC